MKGFQGDPLRSLMRPPCFDLTEKVAIVTGGATGIGRAIAEGFADFGAGVSICGRRMENCQAACDQISARTGSVTLPVSCDVSKKEDVERLIQLTQRKFGRIDILVNNAGVSGNEKEILRMEDEDWDSVININLRGAFLTARAVAPHMIAGGGGKIINIASLAAFMGFARMSSYSASKAGIIQLTKVMALEWAKHNIQVNAVCPGYVKTNINAAFFATDAGKRVIEQKIPLKRLGRTDEMKGVAVFLASGASSFMTGSVVIVDGGQSLL